jgi:hypothetical protein
MRAIRARIPGARFVHTEDVGRVLSTPQLCAQASYENERRWLSLDLLCGMVDRRHDCLQMLLQHGVSKTHLDELAAGEAAPDVVGVNYYVTSDRFLDHRTALYPPHLRGGNGRQAYADTEAVRVPLPEGLIGWGPRLREVWARYRRPIAVTEAHLGCADADESVRWLNEAWETAHALRNEGIPVEAVTAWALFGLVDWDCMLREQRGRVEAGAFDIRPGRPCPTALATAVAGLARKGRIAHACLATAGWWRREDRTFGTLRAESEVAPVS